MHFSVNFCLSEAPACVVLMSQLNFQAGKVEFIIIEKQVLYNFFNDRLKKKVNDMDSYKIEQYNHNWRKK